MAQFSVYVNKNASSKNSYPFLLEVQSNLLSHLSTTVVIPLGMQNQFANMALSKLNPSIIVNETTYILLTQQLAGVQRKILGAQAATVDNQREAILAAVDFMLTGF